MPKYLFQASYSPEGIRGVLRDGASNRRDAAKALVKSLGGKLESFYFTLGSDDVVAVAELPDNGAAAALSATVGATGLVRGKITPLLEMDEADKALGRRTIYRGPGVQK
jgi:uncharacterized protein with GYD domain